MAAVARMLGMLLLLPQLTPALTISDASLVSEGAATFLSLKLIPNGELSSAIISPEAMQALSENLFTLSGNLTLDINASAAVFLYEIDEAAGEPIYSPSLSVWCGASFDDCGRCGGMPPGTFKYCNANYPETSYYCDSWCYTFSPSETHAKAQSGNYIGAKTSAEITISTPNTPTPIKIFIDGARPADGSSAARASLSLPIPASTPPELLIRQQSSAKWQRIQNSPLQNYKNSLNMYYSMYTSSIANAYAATSSLNSALSSLLASAEGEYYDAYGVSPAEKQFPGISLLLDASIAGVSAIRGKPRIASFSEAAQFEAGAAYYSMELENAGAAPDTFSANLSCNGTLISQIPPLLIPNGQKAQAKFFVGQVTTPHLCTAIAFVSEVPSISDSASVTLQPFRLPCPAEKQCCAPSETYEERACASQERFVQDDAYGNGHYLLQHFACESFTCAETTTTFLRRISGNSAPPTAYSFASAADVPQPTSSSSPSPPPPHTPISSPTTPPSNNSTPFPAEHAIEEGGQISINAPSTAPLGRVRVSVIADFMPASGALLLVAPSRSEYAIPLGSDGSSQVQFDEPGQWRLKYGGEVKFIEIIPAAPEAAENQKTAMPASLLALSLADLPLAETAILISFMIFGYAAFKRHSERITFRKSFENNIVRLEILNHKTDLRNLEITDIVPEGMVLSTISNPPSEVTEIIFGKHIKWKKSELKLGERMLISYSIFSESKGGPLKEAELIAETAGSGKIRALSNPI